MRLSPPLRIAWRHARQQPARALLTLFGLSLGVAMLALSIALGVGVRDYVLKAWLQSLPIDMIEAHAPGLDLGFLQMPTGGLLGGTKLDLGRIEALKQLPHVKAAYPKRDVALPLGGQGGAQLFGRALYADLFVTALPQALVQGDAAKGFVDLDPSATELTDDTVIPLVIAPQLIALYNASVAPALNTPVLKAEHLLGFGFELVVGRSLMLGDRGARLRGTQRAVIVGISPFAAPLGASMPWRYAEALLAKYGARNAAPSEAIVSGVIVQAQSPGVIAQLTSSIEQSGLVVDAQAQRVAQVLWGITALLTAAGLLVLSLAASQTAFGLSVYIAERRRQWAILQAMGLSSGQLIALVLWQAGGLGLLGFLMGLALARSASALADGLIVRAWPIGLAPPETLFVFGPSLIAGCLAAALGASLLGALGPAVAAARRAVHLGLRD